MEGIFSIIMGIGSARYYSEDKKMLDSNKPIERILQNARFKKVIPYLKGDVMDFGGNKGELRKFVKGNYLVVNYDHSVMKGKTFDTIVALAIIEHIVFNEVFDIFRKFKQEHLKENGVIFLTTPAKISRPILELGAMIGIEKQNIAEHKHYWTKGDIYSLAEKSGLTVEKYAQFQLGLNQMAIFKNGGTL